MKKLIAIIWKDIMLRFSSPSEWLFFLILPVVFSVILAGGTGAPTDSKVRLVVTDRAQSPLSAQLIAAIEETNTITADVLSQEEAEEAFDDRQAPAYLIIPADLTGETVLNGGVALDLRLLPNNLNALMVEQTIDTAIWKVSSELRVAASSVEEAERIRPFETEAERAAFYEAALQAAHDEWQAAPNRLAVVEASTPDQIDYDPQTNSSAGQMITWVIIPLLGISGSFVYERQIGTLRRMLVTPTRKGLYLFSTILGNVLMAMVQMGLLVGFGVWVMNIHWGNSPGALATLLAATALAAAGIGTAMGAFIKTPGQASGVAIMSGMLMGLLGGCWYPIELFPPAIQNASLVLPTRWAMDGILDLALRGQGFEAILPHIGVLMGFAVVFFAIGVARFRYE